MPQDRTLVHALRRWAEATPGGPALHVRTANGWQARSWRAYHDEVMTVARALIALGHKPGDRVALVGRNRPEWLLSQMGVMAAGGIPAAIYVTNTPEQAAFVARHSESRFVIAEDKGQYEKFLAHRESLPGVERVILWDPVDGRDPKWTLTWAEFLAAGTPGDPAELEHRLGALAPDDLAFLCYTSGTTGDAKGVMLSHQNLVSLGAAVVSRFQVGHEHVISYLPLCHIAEQFFTNVIPLTSGSEVYLCDDLQKLKDYLPEVRPTMFLGVPRVWEKFESALRARLAEASGLKGMLARWALRTELDAFRRELETGAPVGGLGRSIANRLVQGKIRARLGLDRVRVCCTGSAPIPVKTQEFFASLGLVIYEAYGLSETTALLTTTVPGQARFGTVGRPVEGVELKLAEDGEILARGPNLTSGYFRDPERTHELWEGGWLHTGDVGEFDVQGNLRITDRKKDLFKTSGGKYVAPQAIEAKLKTIRGVAQAVAVGDARRYITALLTLDPENAPKAAAEAGIQERDPAALAKDERFRAWLERRVEEDVNSVLARYETVKKIAVVPGEFTVAGGELTPTMKLRRKEIVRKYADLIDTLYVEEPATSSAS